MMSANGFESILAFISQYVNYSEKEFNEVIPYFKRHKIKKNEVFINEGEVARKIAFTCRGYLRVYYRHNGTDVTRDITPINTFVTALPSFISQKPSYEIICAITDCDLLVISKDDLDLLYNKYPKWERLGRRVIEDMFVEAQQRLYLFITETAETRYKNLIKQHPDLIKEVPLKHIADFLGIKLQSLSRLRRNMEW